MKHIGNYIHIEMENKKETIIEKVENKIKGLDFNTLVDIERVIDNIDNIIKIINKIKYEL